MKLRYFGQFLLSEGIVSGHQLLAAIEYQDQFSARLSECAVELGLLEQRQADRIEQVQITRDVQFADAASELELLNPAQIQHVTATVRNDARLLSEALATLGYADRRTIEIARDKFEDEQHRDGTAIPALPATFPELELAFTLFLLTRRVVLQAWHLTAEPVELQQPTQRLLLSDHNTMLELQGDVAAKCFFAVSRELVEPVFHRLTGSRPSPGDLDDTVAELANIISGNVVAALAAEGRSAQLCPPHAIGFQVPVASDQHALNLSYATDTGSLCAGLLVTH